MRSTLVTLHAVTLICNTPRRTAAGLGDVAAEGPLADAPVPHGALEDGLARAPRRVGARRRHVAPVRLARHLAEVGAFGRIHLDADVLRAGIVIFIDTLSIARESRQGHAGPAAVGQGFSVDVEMSRLVEALRGFRLVAKLARAAVEFARAGAGVAAVEPDLAIGRDDVPVRVELLADFDRRGLR